jgi:hypothetical protein
LIPDTNVTLDPAAKTVAVAYTDGDGKVLKSAVVSLIV